MKVILTTRNFTFSFECVRVLYTRNPELLEDRALSISNTSDSVAIRSDDVFLVVLYPRNNSQISFGIKFLYKKEYVSIFVFNTHREMLSALHKNFSRLDFEFNTFNRFFLLRLFSFVEELHPRFSFEIRDEGVIINRKFQLYLDESKFVYYNTKEFIYFYSDPIEYYLSDEEFMLLTKNLHLTISRDLRDYSFQKEKNIINECYRCIKIPGKENLPLLLLRSVVLEETYRLHRMWKSSLPLRSQLKRREINSNVNIILDSNQLYQYNYCRGKILIKRSKRDSKLRILKAISQCKISTVVLCGGFTHNGSDAKTYGCWGFWCETGTHDEFGEFIDDFYNPIKEKVDDVLTTIGYRSITRSFLFRKYSPEIDFVIENHGGVYYHFQKDGVDYYSCGVYPSVKISKWLSSHLDKNNLPTIIFFHYSPMCDAISEKEKEKFLNVILPHRERIIAILSGSYSRRPAAEWNGFRVIAVGRKYPVLCSYNPITKDFSAEFLETPVTSKFEIL